MKSVMRAAFAALALLMGAQSDAAIVTYTSYAAWQTAVGSAFIHKEFFDDATLEPWLDINSDCVVQAPCVLAGKGVSGGSFNDIVDDDPLRTTDWVFDFDNPVIGAGAFWDLDPGGYGIGIELRADGELVGELFAVGPPFTFFGFTSDVAFTQVRLQAGTQFGSQETYSITELDVAEVPEPGTLLLLGSGLTGIALRRRRRNNG